MDRKNKTKNQSAKFAKAIYASSEKSSDLLYASSFFAPDPFLYFEFKGKKMIYVSALERDRAISECKKNIQVIEVSKSDDAVSVLLSLCKKYKPDIINVPYDFPAGIAMQLAEKGVKVKPIKGDFFPERAIKNADEIEKIRAAVKIAEQAMKKAENILAEASVDNKGFLIWHGEKLSSEILRRMINLSICANGASSSNTIAAGGYDAAEPHNTGKGPFKAGTPIIIDIFPRTENGYWGDITRTFIKWKTTEKFNAIYEAVKTAAEKAAEKAAAGAIASELHKHAFDYLRSKGFRTGKMNGKNCGFFHGLGHGLGLDIHEAPKINPKNNSPLQKGNVITIEPGLYYADFGGVRIEDVFAVRKNGAEMLTSYHKSPLIE